MPPKVLSVQTARRLLQKQQTEDDVQQSIIADLRLRGFIVLQTSEHRRSVQCPHCDKYFTPTMGRGCDKGVPDLIVSRENWPDGVFVGLEVKSATGSLTSEQKELQKARRIHIVRSIADAEKSVEESEKWLLG